MQAFLECVPEAMGHLDSGKAVTGTLDRDLQVYKTDPSRTADLARFTLPDDFFSVF